MSTLAFSKNRSSTLKRTLPRTARAEKPDPGSVRVYVNMKSEGCRKRRESSTTLSNWISGATTAAQHRHCLIPTEWVTWLKIPHRFQISPFSQCALQGVFKVMHLGECFQRSFVFDGKNGVWVWREGQMRFQIYIRINADAAKRSDLNI